MMRLGVLSCGGKGQRGTAWCTQVGTSGAHHAAGSSNVQLWAWIHMSQCMIDT